MGQDGINGQSLVDRQMDRTADRQTDGDWLTDKCTDWQTDKWTDIGREDRQMDRLVSKQVTWCFMPSQPLQFISG